MAWARCVYQWGGQVMETVDGLAFIGRNPLDARQRLHRDRRLGHGHDARHDRRHAADRPDSRPARIRGGRSTIPAASRCARRRSSRRRTSTSAAQYARLGHAGRRRARSTRSPKDSGAVIRRGAAKIAVYRDATGALHETIGGLPAPRLHRGVESRREDVGLPVPRLALRQVWRRHQRARERRPDATFSHGRKLPMLRLFSARTRPSPAWRGR